MRQGEGKDEGKDETNIENISFIYYSMPKLESSRSKNR